MNRRRSTSLAGSPLLIGAITTLIAVVAVYLSYNANNGLPFTPTYDINVQLPQASGLQPGNQVRVGGTRVGLIGSLSPQQDSATGRVTAIAHLKLEKGVQPLPADTIAIVQSVSPIGLKYLSLTKGSSAQTLRPGATIPLSHTREPVDIDQLFGMFDKKTRIANQQNLTDFGNGLAGRGIGLNETLAELRPLVERAVPVLRNLASPRTGLHELWIALDRAASEVAPVAEAQAGFYSNLDTFLAAWASVAPSLEEAIEGGPAALRQATHSLPFEAPFVEKSAEFMRLLRPGASALRTTAGPLGHAFAVGAVNLRSAVALNGEIAEASKALGAFAQNPIVQSALEDLTHTLTLGNPLVAGLKSVQADCNYATLSFRNIASLLSESIGVGTVARAAPLLAPAGSPSGTGERDPNNEGLPASAPANGPSFDVSASGGKLEENHLHANPYPQVGPRVCEAGNEPYLVGRAVIGNVPAKVSAAHETTKRSENFFGETYPSQTLSDLGKEALEQAGLIKPKKKGKGK
jgi:phospholipid/cholesterol/gamma-HCH transport system substrate-binding protein